MTADVEKVAIVVGALGTIALVYFAMRSGGGGSAGGFANFTPIVGTMPGVDVTQIRTLKSQEKIAEINADVSKQSNWLKYLLGMEVTQSGERVSFRQADASERNTQTEANASIRRTEVASEAARYAAERNAYATERQAYYDYEKTRQQEKSKRNKNVTDGVFGTIGKVLSFI